MSLTSWSTVSSCSPKGRTADLAHGAVRSGSRFPERLAEVDYEGGVIEYEIDGPPFRKGENEIEVRTTMRTVMKSTTLSLRHVELQIEYDV